MTLVMVDGFDTGNVWLKYNGTPSGASISSASPITGHGSYALINQINNPAIFTIPTAQKDDVLTVAGYVRRTSGATSDDGATDGGIFRLAGDAGATIHVTIAEVVGDGSLRVRRGGANGTTLGTTATGQMVVDTWVHIALRVTLSDTVGTVDVWVNGVNVLSLTNQDTKNAGTETVFSTVEFHGTANGSTARSFDDVYITNGLGSVNTGNLGVCRVNFLLPTTDGSLEEWALSAGSDSFAMIDEATPDGDSTYIQDDTVGQVTRVNLADLTDTDHTVYGLLVSNNARKDDAGAASMIAGMRSGSSDSDGASKALTEQYALYWDIHELNPDGSVAWTPTTVNAAEAFVEVV